MKIFNLVLKRLFDIFISFISIILFSPIFIIISVSIILDSKGSIIFKQKRLGKGGKEFNIYKFRTMIVDAENIGTGVFTSGSDIRVTKVGKFLRGTSLDELPQLFNVLLGNMSIVGPRPPVTYHPYKYSEYPAKYKTRFNVKPGITGYAQIIGRNTLSWEDRFKLDLKYIEKMNIFFDIYIIFKTVLVFTNKKEIFDIENKKNRR